MSWDGIYTVILTLFFRRLVLRSMVFLLIFLLSFCLCDDDLFMIRAEYIASSIEASNTVLNGLKIVVSYQYPYHPGVLTYNFDRIDPVDPTVLMFSEMYANQGVFLNHTNHTEIQKLWPIIFKKSNEKSMECVVYGNPSPISKQILTYLFNTTYLKTLSGYLFSERIFYKQTEEVHNPLFVTMFLYSKNNSTSRDSFIKGVSQLSDLETNSATTLHLGERRPGIFEFLMIYKNANFMVDHLNKEGSKILRQYFLDASEKVDTTIWLQKPGTWKKSYKEVFSDAGIGINENYLNVGYNVHPRADPHSSC